MTYKLYFHPAALKEWKKLSPDICNQFKKILERRLENPHVPNAALSGKLKNCYKIKLRQSGYRLVYKVDDQKIVLLIVAVGKRDKSIVYSTADQRI